MAIGLRNILEYTLISIPLYVFIGSPFLRIIFPSWYSSESTSSYQSFEPTDSLVLPNRSLSCSPPHHYSIRLLSREPLVIYIENFLSHEEAHHLVKVSEPLYTPATIHSGTEETFDPSIRNSSKALLPRDDIVQCIENRAHAFQGSPKDVYIERLWAQKYLPGGHYVHHYDWSGDLRSRGAGRISTFMVYVGCDDCVGGGTEFPRLPKPVESEWCQFVDCNNDYGNSQTQGVTFKPIQGNAVFWENFQSSGHGWEQLWHSGLPVKRGVKVGLNIWSWYQADYRQKDP